MKLENLLKNILKKSFRKQSEKTPETIDLFRWNLIISNKQGDGWIQAVVHYSNVNDLAAALTWTDEKIKQRFIDAACRLNSPIHKMNINLVDALEKNKNVSKQSSDKMKSRVANLLAEHRDRLIGGRLPTGWR
jgi:hypothetical protein